MRSRGDWVQSAADEVTNLFREAAVDSELCYGEDEASSGSKRDIVIVPVCFVPFPPDCLPLQVSKASQETAKRVRRAAREVQGQAVRAVSETSRRFNLDEKFRYVYLERQHLKSVT